MEIYSQFDVSPNQPAPSGNIYANSDYSSSGDDWLYQSLVGSSSESGVAVTPNSALSHGPVWQAVNLISGDLGQLPFRKMVRRGRERSKDRANPLDLLMRFAPNGYQAPSVWKETMISWSLLWGNGISYIVRDARMRPIELLPLLPDRTGYCVEGGARTVHTRIGNETFFFNDWELFHVRGLATDGFWGRSAIEVAKEVLGYGIGLRKHGSKTFQNGAVPRGVIEHPGRLTTEARSNLRNEWNAIHGGLDNASRVAIMMEGAKFTQTSISNIDAQWLEAVKLDREQIASLFNLPAHKLNALENAAVRANVEEQNRSYMQMSLSRWLNKFREEADLKLLTKRERNSGDHYFKWFTEAFLRGDTKARFDAYSLAIASRWLSPNEVREKEDMNPYEGGDEYANPSIDLKPDISVDGEPIEQEEAAIAVLRSRIESLLEFESNRVVRGAKAKNFVAWFTGFYDEFEKAAEQYIQPVARLLHTMGRPVAWRKFVQEHAEISRSSLLRITDTATAANLAEHVQQFSGENRELTDDLTSAITQKELGNV